MRMLKAAEQHNTVPSLYRFIGCAGLRWQRNPWTLYFFENYITTPITITLATCRAMLALPACLLCLLCRLEVAAGRMDAARRVLLRAVRECPGHKPLWMEGLRALNGVSGDGSFCTALIHML